jgi:transposase InsO family protein
VLLDPVGHLVVDDFCGRQHCDRAAIGRVGVLRDELLNSWQFDSLLEARVIIEDWRIDYNEHRPHSAHGELTPSEFARAWTINHQPEAA